MVVQSMIKGNFQYEYFSSVTQRRLEWVWYPYIPYGKLTILSERTIQTVKKGLGITSYHRNSVWLWRIHDDADSSSWEIKNA